MQLTPQSVLLQHAHALQQSLFPRLEEELGPLGPAMRLLSAVLSLVPAASLASAHRAATGRPARDRAALAAAFLAKAVFNLATTRQLIDRLKCDSALRRLCGWSHARQIPSESKFSRAFARFAVNQLPQQMQAAFVAATQKDRLIGHIARDSTAIPTREHAAEALLEQKRQAKKRQARKPGKKPGRKKARAADRGPRIERQLHQTLDVMVAALPKACDIGAKRNSQGHNNYWRGHKLHIDVADGQIPISALLTSASVHDSQVAIPLMKMTSSRVTYLYELMDSAYDADAIHACSRQMNHAPIIAVHSRRGTKKASELTKVFPAKPAPELSWAERERYKERTMVERVNARLKDEFGASRIRVRGAEKVMAHLMYGLVALGVDQWLRLTE